MWHLVAHKVLLNVVIYGKCKDFGRLFELFGRLIEKWGNVEEEIFNVL